MDRGVDTNPDTDPDSDFSEYFSFTGVRTRIHLHVLFRWWIGMGQAQWPSTSAEVSS